VNRSRLVPWLMLGVWASWLAALQGLLVAKTDLAYWVPDTLVLLLVTCAGRFQPKDVTKAAIVLAISRIAFSVEPPAAVLCGFMVTALCVRGVRSVAEVGGPLVRASVAGVGAWGVAAWLLFVHAVRDDTSFDLASLLEVMPECAGLWRVGLTTALVALFFGPAFALLPGLTPLRKKRW